MPLTGEAKKEYQREYMRKRRMLNKNNTEENAMLDLERLRQVNAQKQELARTEEQKRLEAELGELAGRRLALAEEIEKVSSALVEKAKEYLDLCTPIFTLAKQLEINTHDGYRRREVLFSYFCRTFGSIFPDMPPAAYKGGLVESEKAVMGGFLEGSE